MEVLMSKLVAEMRIAMDEVVHDNQNDIFADDSDKEMEQAIETAAQQLLLQAPYERLLPQSVKVSLNTEGAQDYDAIQTQYTDGHGSLVIPDDWLRLVALWLKSWRSPLTELMDPGSKEAQMQASLWTRGTPQKPKGMITTSPTTGKRELMYWTAGRYDANHAEAKGQVYNHEVRFWTYVPYPKVEEVTLDNGHTDKKLTIALSDDCRRYLVYRAISIFLVSKKESELGEKYNQLSQI